MTITGNRMLMLARVSALSSTARSLHTAPRLARQQGTLSTTAVPLRATQPPQTQPLLATRSMSTLFSSKTPVAFSKSAAARAELKDTFEGTPTSAYPRLVVVGGVLIVGFMVANMVFGERTEWPDSPILTPLRAKLDQVDEHHRYLVERQQQQQTSAAQRPSEPPK
ncbi:hypothetical protein CAOG_008086 [Capsaspora owczarzaki ATCC 30864]|uniref:Uncharacterized protein n=2 Tax=Capsaspora owczarzaki (strain ATCC 30864) TaxID=595528 RepID=A0A0D2X5M1_CAPO3|nr:hypothetical protein CAOG_008086 [Capsaspora owczarzaki ATCC 30864]